MKTLKTKHFKDVAEFVYSVLDQYETYKIDTIDEDFVGVSIVAPYKVLISVLNYIVKNTSFEMKNIHLEDGECADYYDEWILTIDPEGKIWIQVAKHKTGYIFTEDNIVFVHGDVNSAFVKKNEKENLVAFEIGDGEDTDEKPSDESSSKDCYHVSLKCDLDADEVLKTIDDMEKRISRINELMRIGNVKYHYTRKPYGVSVFDLLNW